MERGESKCRVNSEAVIVDSASARLDGRSTRKDSIVRAKDWVRVESALCESVGMQSFRRLIVWRRGHELALAVRRAARSFPRSERGSLKKQMISSAESIVFNIVEGCGASGAKEFARFLDISIKSTGELEYQLELAVEAELLSGLKGTPLAAEAVEIRRMLCVLRRRVLEPRPKPTGN